MAATNWYTHHESSIKAKHIHSININGYNTWDDWHIIPATRPVIKPPSKKRTTYDIVGLDGLIDESEAITPYPVYSSRTGQLTFYVDPDYGPWDARYSDISDAIHGLNCNITFDDIPSWYYYGYVAVNDWQSNKDRSTIVLDYDVYPYKLAYASSDDQDWLWDPFDFNTDWIYSKPGNGLNLMAINSPDSWVTFTAPVGYFAREPVEPIIKLSSTNDRILLRLDNPELGIYKEQFTHEEEGTLIDGEVVPYSVSDIENGSKIANFVLSSIKPSNQPIIYLKGTGTISFVFRTGRLG